VPPNLVLPLIYSLGLSKTWEICGKLVVCTDLADILGSPWGEAKLGVLVDYAFVYSTRKGSKYLATGQPFVCTSFETNCDGVSVDGIS
jgi:hypothetical protein